MLPSPNYRILVVEDESDIAALIAYQLTREGLRVETAGNGMQAMASIGRAIPDLVILDRMLPDISGDEILQRLKREPTTSSIPVLVLTAKSDQQDVIGGFELGADDYLTKPFDLRELVLRVQAILRRLSEAGLDAGGRILRAGPLSMNVSAYQVSLDGREINLTPTEFRLLRALLERPGYTQSRRQLLQKAWDVEPGTVNHLETRTVDMHVQRLRGKLGKVGDCIETLRGVGYRLKTPLSDQ